MFTLVKINDSGANYTDKQILKKREDEYIPLGVFLKMKDGVATVAEKREMPEFLSTDASPKGSLEIPAIPVTENMLFEAVSVFADDQALLGAAVSLGAVGDGAGVILDEKGCGRIVSLLPADKKIHIQFKQN